MEFGVIEFQRQRMSGRSEAAWWTRARSMRAVEHCPRVSVGSEQSADDYTVYWIADKHPSRYVCGWIASYIDD